MRGGSGCGWRAGGGRRRRGGLAISVSDTGRGIPEEFKPLLFGAFQQPTGQDHARFGGTGLGLAISQRLAKLMNGAITVENNPAGRGSVFTVTLRAVPMVAAPGVPETGRKAAERIVFLDPPKVLVADEVDSSRELIKSYLAPYGFEVVEAADARQALDAMAEETPGLVLTEIQLPGMDPAHYVRRLRAAAGSREGADGTELDAVPVLAVTASVPGTRARREETAFDEVLTKPMVREDLIRALARFVPYSVVAVESAPEAPAPAPNPAGGEDWLSAVPEELTIEMGAVRKSLRVRQAKTLGEQLQALGADRGLPRLEALAGELIQAAELFQIGRLKGLLNRLEEGMNPP